MIASDIEFTIFSFYFAKMHHDRTKKSVYQSLLFRRNCYLLVKRDEMSRSALSLICVYKKREPSTNEKSPGKTRRFSAATVFSPTGYCERPKIDSCSLDQQIILVNYFFCHFRHRIQIRTGRVKSNGNCLAYINVIYMLYVMLLFSLLR